FRGYMLRALEERWHCRVAALVTSAGFALMHANNPNVSAAALINTFLAGLVLALLVERSGSLWSATLAHGVWNFAVASLASLPVSGLRVFHLLETSVSGPEPVTGGGFGPEGSLLLTVLAVPLLAVLWPRPSPPAPLPRAGGGGKTGTRRKNRARSAYHRGPILEMIGRIGPIGRIRPIRGSVRSDLIG